MIVRLFEYVASLPTTNVLTLVLLQDPPIPIPRSCI